MQSSRMICYSCRRHLIAAALLRARVPRIPHWQARSPFRSASSTTQPTQFRSPDDFVSSLDHHDTNPDIDPDIDMDIDMDIIEPWATGDNAPTSHDAEAPNGHRSPGRFMSVSRTARIRKTLLGPSRKTSMKIFENVVRQQAAQEKKAAFAANPRDLSPEGVEYYTNLAKLRPMMKAQKIEDCLEFFLAKLWKKAPFEGRNRLLIQRGAYLMGKVAEAKIANFDNEALPSISQITQYFHEMDSLGSQRWSNMMMGLIKAILEKSTVRSDYESDEAYETAKVKKENLIEDLIDSWILFHRHKMSANYSSLLTSEEAEFRLPDINLDHLRHFAWKQNYKGALGCIFPEWMAQIREIPAVAIATFVLLVDDNHSTISAQQKAKPLLIPIGHVVSACPIRQAALAEMLEPHPTILLYVLKQWDAVIQRLRGRTGSYMKETGQGKEHRREDSITRASFRRLDSVNEKTITNKIRHAIGMSDALTLDLIWRGFWGPDRVLKDPGRIKDCPRIFNHFIMAFTALQKPNRAIDTWDAMVSVGLSPTLETWSSMIEGCRKANNGAGIENVWRKLVASGLPLDEAVWTSRIMGLMETNEPDAGLRALREMHKMSHLPDGVPLSIKAVNAAVTGLLRLNAKSAANQVLHWASQHGIEPDVFTYNILLRPLIQKGQAAEIKSMLKLMSDSNIKPNAATYTILLEGLMSSTQDLDSTQQRLSVERLLADMDRDGVEPNLENLGRMLFLVLRDSKHTKSHVEGAVGAIFKYVDSKGLPPSPHMLTMQVDHYFSQVPPAIDDVERLLQKYNRSRVVDRVFWERVIRGYALAGATGPAFDWYERTFFTSFIITLDTLEVLLRALVKDNKMSAAARVVDNVKQHRGTSTGSINNSHKYLAQRTRWDRYWKHGFWGYAMDCGLLGAAEWRKMAEAQQPASPDVDVTRL